MRKALSITVLLASLLLVACQSSGSGGGGSGYMSQIYRGNSSTVQTAYNIGTQSYLV